MKVGTMTDRKTGDMSTVEVKRLKADITTQFAFEDDAKRLAKLAAKSARLRALREARQS
jgi:hypothetical protein